MQTMSLKAGEAAFRQGEPSKAVYVIDHGEIAIKGHDDGEDYEVVRFHDGALFGKSGVLENRPRSASAIATMPTTLLVTDAESFLTAFGINDDKAIYLLKLLCARLRDTTRAGAHHAARDLSHAALMLIPDSERLSAMIGTETVPIREVPFLVGNRFGGEVSPISTERNYSVPAGADTELASPHFEILKRDGKFVIRDLSRGIGTIVNGKLLSRYSQESVAELHLGENLVIAGHGTSPFRWRLLTQ